MSASRRPHVHVVHRGDTMWSIARRTGMDVNILATMNGMQPGDPLRAGQRIKLRTRSLGGRGRRTAQVPYTVRAGDTLTRIAKLFQCSVKEIWPGTDSAPTPGICAGRSCGSTWRATR